MQKVTLYYTSDKKIPLNKKMNFQVDFDFSDSLETKQSLIVCREFYENSNQFLYEFEIEVNPEELVDIIISMNKGDTCHEWFSGKGLVFTKRYDIEDFYSEIKTKENK